MQAIKTKRQRMPESLVNRGVQTVALNWEKLKKNPVLTGPELIEICDKLEVRRRKREPLLLEYLVNLTNMRKFKELFEFEDLADSDISAVRDQLLGVWGRWIETRDLAFEWALEAQRDLPGLFLVYLNLGSIPEMTLKGAVAEAMLRQFSKCRFCVNPTCKQPYVAMRKDQKYCTSPKCNRYRHNVTAKNWYRKQQRRWIQ